MPGFSLAAVGAFLVAYGGTIATVISLAATAYMLFSAPDIDGPRIGDVKVQTSTYGKVIPIGYGRIRLAGNIIWAMDIVESKSKIGGNLFGGGKQVIYDYFVNFAVGLSEGPAAQVIRIWANRKVIFDESGGSMLTRKYPSMDIRRYMGTSTQQVDPLIEKDLGIGLTPAFRGRVYVVFDRMPLKDMGNRIPNMDFEVQYKTPASDKTIELGAMFDWAIDWAMESKMLGYLYLVRRHDVEFNSNLQGLAIWDIFEDTVIVSTGNNPYVNEGIFGANGFDPWGGVFPADDGLVYASGSDRSSGRPALVQVNPITLDLIFSWDLFELAELTNNVMKRGNITWNKRDAKGSNQFILMMFNGEGGGFPDVDNDKWLFVHRGLADGGTTPTGEDGPRDANGNLILANAFRLHEFDHATRGPVWGNASAVDSNGDLWICGYMDNPTDNSMGILGNRSAKLWKVVIGLSRTASGENPSKFYVNLVEHDLATLDPSGRIQRPQLMVYDSSSDTLTIWGGIDPDGDYGIVQYHIPTNKIINSRYYKVTIEPELQPHRLDNGAGGSVIFHGALVYFSNGTDVDGNIPFQKFSPAAANEWTIFNAPNFTFTFNQPGPRISGFVSQYYWYQDLDYLYVWNGPSTDNPLDDNPEKFERNSINAANDTLDAIVKSLITDVRVPESQVSTDAGMAAQIVDGFVIAKQGRVRDAINPLGSAYLFDALESDSKIAFRSRDLVSSRTIPQKDLGANSGSDGKGEEDVILTKRFQETDIPMRVDITYVDQARDYQEGNQHAQRATDPSPTQHSNSVSAFQFPLVLSPNQSKAIAESKLYDSWAARLFHRFQVGPRHMDIEPSDVITVQKTGSPNILMRMAQTQMGEAFVSRMESVTHDPEVYTTVGTGVNAALTGGRLVLQGPTRAFLLDLPFILDEHGDTDETTGLYVAMGGYRPAWKVGIIARSEFGTAGPFTLWEASKGRHAWGFLKETLPALAGTERLPHGTGTTSRFNFNDRYMKIDYDDGIKLHVVNVAALLASTTEDIMLETGVNMAVIREPSDLDRFEIFQYVNVSITDGVATLTGILRGLRGTESMSQAGFTKGAEVVFLDLVNATSRVANPLSDIDSLVVYKIQTARELLPTDQLRWFIARGADLMPLSAGEVRVDPGSGIRSSSTITVFWERRSRIGGADAMKDEVTEIKLGEATPKWEVELIDKGLETVNITKTLDTGPSNAPYATGVPFTVAERTTAGYTNNEKVRVKIYQLSDNVVVGRGFVRDVTV